MSSRVSIKYFWSTIPALVIFSGSHDGNLNLQGYIFSMKQFIADIISPDILCQIKTTNSNTMIMTENLQVMAQELDKLQVERTLAKESGWQADLVTKVSVDNL